MQEKIKLVSSAGTGHFYTTTKNKKNTPEKMEIKKYDPVVRKHVMYKKASSRSGFTMPPGKILDPPAASYLQTSRYLKPIV